MLSRDFQRSAKNNLPLLFFFLFRPHLFPCCMALRSSPVFLPLPVYPFLLFSPLFLPRNPAHLVLVEGTWETTTQPPNQLSKTIKGKLNPYSSARFPSSCSFFPLILLMASIWLYRGPSRLSHRSSEGEATATTFIRVEATVQVNQHSEHILDPGRAG